MLDALGQPYEIVFGDDGSRDETLGRLFAARACSPPVKILVLSRTFGMDVALTPSPDHAAGAAVIAIDVDLQDPPGLIPEMVAKSRAGFEVVYARVAGQRQRRQGFR